MPKAIPEILNSKYLTKYMLRAIFKRQKKDTIKLETLVFCRPMYRPVKTYIVSSAGAEKSLIVIYVLIKL